MNYVCLVSRIIYSMSCDDVFVVSMTSGDHPCPPWDHPVAEEVA